MNDKLKKIIIIAAIILSLILAIRIFEIKMLFISLIGGFVISWLLTPIYEFLKKKMNPNIALGVLILSLTASLVFAFFLLLPIIISQTKELIEKIPELVEFLNDNIAKINEFLKNKGLPDINIDTAEFSDYIKSIDLEINSDGISQINRYFDIIIAIVMIPIYSFYFLKDKEFFARLIEKLIPTQKIKMLKDLSNKVNTVLFGYIQGTLWVSVAVGLLSFVAYSALGIKGALTLAMIMGVMELLPYFGPIIGAVPAVLVVAINDSGKLLILIALMLLVQQIEGIFIQPLIMGNVVKLHPVFIIISILIGGALFGFLGIILAVPFVLFARCVIQFFYTRYVNRNVL